MGCTVSEAKQGTGSAEVVICVGTRGKFRDGDVIEAFSYDRKRYASASEITHQRRAARYSNGHLRTDTSCRYWFEYTLSSAFERVDSKHARELPYRDASGNIRSEPTGELIHKVDALDARLRVARPPPNGQIFGEKNSQWFGRREHAARADIDRVWLKIEELDAISYSSVDLRQPQPQQFGRLLWVLAADFDEVAGTNLVAPLLNPDDPEDSTGEGSIVATRKCWIDWRQLEGMTPERIAKIENPSDLTDWRLTIPAIDVSAVVQEKTRGRRR